MGARHRHSARARLRYRVDAALLRGTGQVVLWLAVTTLVLVLAFALVLGAVGVTTGGHDGGFGERAWITLTRALDPGTMADDTGWTFRLTSLLVTLSGVLVFSALIGLITSAIEAKVGSLRRGRSQVVVSDHTLILGWSAKLAPLISELCVANENLSRRSIVVLAPRDALEMDEQLRADVPDRLGTTVVCRTGDPRRAADLAIVDPAAAKSIIVLSPEVEHPDGYVTKACLGLLQALDGSNCPVIAELRDERHARSLRAATPEHVEVVVSVEVAAEIVARTSRHPGLTAVFEELLDFEGDEIYFQREPGLVGEPFSTALLSYPSSTPIGLVHDGGVTICPPLDQRIEATDQIIAISEDDDTLLLGDLVPLPAGEVDRPSAVDRSAEHLLVLGWSELGPKVLAALDPYVGAGSTAHVVFDPTTAGPEVFVVPDGLEHIAATSERADTTDEALLRPLLADGAGHGDGAHDRVVVLCYRDGWDVGDADAHSLVTFLLVRRLLDELTSAGGRPSVLVEVLEDASAELVEVREHEDMVVSERLTALLMSQLSENRSLASVFATFFDPQGIEITARPLARYADLADVQTFGDLVVAVARCGEICIGIQRDGSGASVRINPDKDERIEVGDDDLALILLARRPAPVEVSDHRAAASR
jgi:hypothetical protein